MLEYTGTAKQKKVIEEDNTNKKIMNSIIAKGLLLLFVTSVVLKVPLHEYEFHA